MIPFFPQEEPKSAEEKVREQIAAEGKRLKEELSHMTPEERARFWAEIEGAPDKKTGSPPPSE